MQNYLPPKRLFFGMLNGVLNVFKSGLIMLILLFGCSTTKKMTEQSEYHKITEKKVEISKKFMWSDTMKIVLPDADSHQPIADSLKAHTPNPSREGNRIAANKLIKKVMEKINQSKSVHKSFDVEQDGKKAQVKLYYNTKLDSDKVITTIESLKVQYQEKKEVYKKTEKSEVKKQSTFWKSASFFMMGLSLVCLIVVAIYILRR